MSIRSCTRYITSRSSLIRQIHSSPLSARSESTEPASTTQSELEAAKARAWYLPSSSTSTSASTPSTSTSTSSSTSFPLSSSSQSTQPRFTTFDPNRTTPLLPAIPSPPLPPTTPAHLHPLHEFLTTQASDVIDPSEVRFYDTSKAERSLKAVGEDLPVRKGQGKRGRRGFNLGTLTEGEGVVRGEREEGGEEVIRGAASGGARWDWVVVVQVKGRGKGVVGRAERVIRQWLHENPLDGSGPPKIKYPKHPSPPAETDWSLIDVGKGSGVCINLLTAEGRERWGLEDVWGSSGDSLLDS